MIMRWLLCNSTLKQVTVSLNLPRRDAEVIGLPFPALVADKLIAQFPAQRLFDEGIGGEGLHGVGEVLGQELNAPIQTL